MNLYSKIFAILILSTITTSAQVGKISKTTIDNNLTTESGFNITPQAPVSVNSGATFTNNGTMTGSGTINFSHMPLTGGRTILVTATTGSPTVTTASTTGIAVGMIVYGSHIPTSPVTTVLSIVPNTSITLSANIASGLGTLPIPITFVPPAISIPGPNGTANLRFAGGISDVGNLDSGSPFDMILQNDNNFGNVIDVQNTNTAGFDAWVFRDDLGYDQMAFGVGNASTGSFFGNHGYIEMANSFSSGGRFSTPFAFDIDSDGPYGLYGAGFRQYNRFEVGSDFTEHFRKQSPFNGWSLSGTTHSNTTLDGLSTTGGIWVGANVSGTGIQANTTVAAVTSSSAVTLSIAATNSATNTMTFGANQQWDQAAFTDALVTLNEPMTINAYTVGGPTIYPIIFNNINGGGGNTTFGLQWQNNGSATVEMGYYTGGGGAWQFYDRQHSQALLTISPISSAASTFEFNGTPIIDSATASTLSYFDSGKNLKSVTLGSGLGLVSGTLSNTGAPATSGTSILKGNGSGGFSNAAPGTDYAPATSGSAILKGNLAGGFSNASAGTDFVGLSNSNTLTAQNALNLSSTTTGGPTFYPIIINNSNSGGGNSTYGIQFQSGGSATVEEDWLPGSSSLIFYDRPNGQSLLQMTPVPGGLSTEAFTGFLSVTKDITTSGNLIVNIAGSGLQVKGGTNARIGISGAMTAGSVTVGNTSVASGDMIILGVHTPGGTAGAPYISSRTNGTGFTISSTSTLDSSTVDWMLVQKN